MRLRGHRLTKECDILIGESLPFIRNYIVAINESIKRQDPDKQLTRIQCCWLSFVILGLWLPMSGMFRQAQIVWELLLQNPLLGLLIGFDKASAEQAGMALMVTAQIGISFATNPLAALELMLVLVSTYLGTEIAVQLERALIDYLLEVPIPEKKASSTTQPETMDSRESGNDNKFVSKDNDEFCRISRPQTSDHQPKESAFRFFSVRRVPSAVSCVIGTLGEVGEVNNTSAAPALLG